MIEALVVCFFFLDTAKAPECADYLYEPPMERTQENLAILDKHCKEVVEWELALGNEVTCRESERDPW